jgi:general secretion pathway protein A
LTIAGGSASVAFTAKALALVHRISGGIPRLINLLCDRALLAGFSLKANRITPEMVQHAATSLELQSVILRPFEWFTRRGSLASAAAVVLLAAALAVGATAWLYEEYGVDTLHASPHQAVVSVVPAGSGTDVALPAASVALPAPSVDRRLPADAPATVLAGSYLIGTDSGGDAAVSSLTNWLEASGYHVYYAQVDLGAAGHWQRVLAGAYTDQESAAAEADRLNRAAPGLDAQALPSVVATGTNR